MANRTVEEVARDIQERIWSLGEEVDLEHIIKAVMR